MIPAVAGALISAGGTLLTNVLSGNKSDQQYQDQERLQDLQTRGYAETAEINRQNAMKMWEDTNYPAQRAEMEKAGLSPGLMYGGGGGGGTTTSGAQGAMPSTATADGPSIRTQTNNSSASTLGQIGMMLAQATLMDKQKENVEADTTNKVATTPNIEADTENKTATKANIEANTENTATDTKLKQFQNDVNNAVGVDDTALTKSRENASKQIDYEKNNAEWETFKSTGYPSGNYTDENNPVNQAMSAGWHNAIVQLQQAKATLDLTKATTIVKQFEADLSKQGIAPNSPWYVKIVSDLLTKAGINPTQTVANTVK